MSRRFRFSQNPTNLSGTLHKYVSTFTTMVYRRLLLEKGRTEALDKSCNVMKVHISCKIFFTANRTMYEILT